MKWNLSRIMSAAWKNFRKYAITFSEALHRAWLSAKAETINAERIEAVKKALGLDGQMVKTWSGWKAEGREVIHGEKASFQITLIYGSKGDGATYKASFFTLYQTQEAGA